MDSDQLLEELTHCKKLPAAAIREATERREEMLPIFLREIERFLADADPVPKAPTSLFMVLHILGSWCEKSASRPVARLQFDSFATACSQSPPPRLSPVKGEGVTY
jgi:hypothetical protein